MAVRMLTEAESALGIGLPATLAFDAATLAGFADAVDRLCETSARRPPSQRVFALSELGRGPPRFFVQVDIGLGTRLPRPVTRPLYALRPWTVQNGFQQRESVRALAAAGLSEIRAIQPRASGTIGWQPTDRRRPGA